jgi:aryl-alcohol dehydrogenase-like predicted oxidoreductase
MEKAYLGMTGIEVSRLCFGTGTSGWGGRSDQSKLGIKGLCRLLRFAYECGTTFWDSADQYGTHPHVAEALLGLKRESVVITTKTCARTREEAEKDIKRFLKELRTDYIDIALLHCLMDPNWPSNYASPMEALSRAKEEGLIRAHGVSCHDFRAFKAASVTPWVDVVLARINYAGTNMDATPTEVIPVIERMHAAGKGIYGMKVMGQGRLGNDPRGAIRYVLGLSSIDSIVIGMGSEKEVRENTKLVEEMSRVGV